MEIIWRDFAYAIRQLRNSPFFAVAAVATMALGIGANTAVFSVVYGLLLESLPFRDAGRIVSILETHPSLEKAGEVTYPDFQDWQAQQTSFEQLGAYSTLNPSTVALRLNGHSEQVHRVLASGNFFSLLGVTPVLGRIFTESDDLPGGEHVAVLSAAAWQGYYGGSPDIVGRIIDLDGSLYRVIGVLPPRAAFPVDGEVWLPLSLLDKATQSSRVWHSVRVLGRLRPAVSLATAKTEMETIAGRIAKANPATNSKIGVELSPLREQFVGTLRPAILCVMGSVFLVLLIACANVANLLMVRASELQRDLAIRKALGASRSRIFSQFLAQSALICLFGGAFGIAFAEISLPLIRLGLSHEAALDLSMIESIRLSLPVLILSLGVCFVTALSFGFLPAAGAGSNLSDRTMPADRGHTGGRAARENTLIAGEIAVAVVVAFLSLLMIRSFQKLQAVDPGYRSDHLLSFEITLPQPHYQDSSPETSQFYDQLLKKLQVSPGVVSVATTNQTPLNPSLAMTRFLIAGEPPLPSGAFPMAQIRFVNPDFFSAMGLGVLNGRTFTHDELLQQANAFIVNQAFAQQYLAHRNPIGAKIVIGVLSPQPTSIAVIGVVSNAHDLGISMASPPEIFLPGFGVHEVILIRARTDPHLLIPTIRNAVRTLDAGLPVYHIRTIDEVLSDSVALSKATAILLAIFAVLALILAAIGIYGVLAYSVERRTREIGVRMAVGAQRRDILKLVTGQAFRFVTAGVLAGLLVAFLCARLVNGLLFETRIFDPLSTVLTICVLIGISLLAVSVPARRAALLNPIEALRTE
jgi:predicted permease